MFSFFFKKARLQAALFALIPVLLTGLLVVSCEQPAGGIDPVDAQAPSSISVQPQDSSWNVQDDDEFTLTVTANSPDGGTLSYQWYKGANASTTTGGDPIGTGNGTLTLEKAHYTGDGDLYFYVVVTNTNNAATKTKTAAATSDIAKVTVSGNGVAMVDTEEPEITDTESDNGVVMVNAEEPEITGITTNPAGGEWNVTQNNEFTLTVTASVTDGGILSYQWYKGDDPIGEDDETLTLDKEDYHGDGEIHFYVAVTNTIAESHGGNNTATATSEVVTVTVSGNGVVMVNAEEPEITVQPTGGNWNVSNANSFPLTVTANRVDDGTLSYQWYRNTNNSTTGGITIGTGTPLTLTKADYEYNITYYFYVVVTNTITENHDGGIKTATATSSAATVTITGGSDVILIYTTEDMAKIGVEESHPLSAKYLLMNDITLEEWSPIGGGHSYTGVGAFSGKFDGNNHTITLNNFDDKPVGSIYVYSELGTSTPANPSTYNNVFLGIFGAIKGTRAEKAEVKNLKVHATVSTTPSEAQGSAAGLVAGYGEHAVFDNITLSGTFTSASGLGYAAGVVAITRSEGTIIKNCNSSVKMDINPRTGVFIFGIANSFSYIGGIVGYMEDKVGIENCHTNGDVKAVSTVSGSQVLTGGILGGTYYAFSNSYHGYVIDCSSAGNITVGAMGSWPMAGGIAGVICGGHGTLEGSTRIVRSYATGTVTNASTANSFPYIGGIVGYVYFGAWVSQCYFDGTVIGEMGAQDYTGGIAGYNSYATSNKGVPGVVEDCWSAGKVRGRNNAAGIVGQNQQNCVLRRSYSRAVIETNTGSTYGAGGITGLNASTLSGITDPSWEEWKTKAVTACVALNPSVTAKAGNNIHRVISHSAGTKTNNYAWSGMAVTTGGTYTPAIGADDYDGADCDAKPNQKFYEDIGWDFANVWKMGADGYPQLKWQK
jgi:hypothetical protein